MNASCISAPAALRKPDLVTDRPSSPAPIYHQIPAELQARAQWVVWAWALDKNGKWTKVPYNARSGGKASSKAPRTWSTFEQAKRAYLENPIGLAGIGYVFSKDDPYCGADFDHCRNPETGEIASWAAGHIAALRAAGAYIEISVSGTGVHVITLAAVGKGIKKALGEVYDRGRYFTMSGRSLDPTPIRDGQPTIDALRAELGSSNAGRAARDSSAGDGDRAALAAKYTAEFEAGRLLNHTSRDLLLKRFLKATEKEGTQGHFAARLLWAELHHRWPFVGLYRADGSLDDSQTRATMGRAIYGRGFTFAEYTVIMSYHFAAQALAKWGTKQAWREELAAIWEDAIAKTAYTPRGAAPRPRTPAVAKRKPVGRASNHAAQVEKIYQALLAQRIGDKAIVRTAELAAECGMHRVTLAGILAELRSAGRIATERLGQYGGLVVSFPDVAIVADSLTVMPPAATPIEETKELPCVSSPTREAGYSSKHPRRLRLRKMRRRAPALAALAAYYLDQPVPRLPHMLLDQTTGEIRIDEKQHKAAYRRSARHFAGLVVDHYGNRYTAEQAIEAYATEKHHREALARAEWRRFFAWLDKTSVNELIAYIAGGCKAEVAAMCRGAQSFDRHQFHIKLGKAKERLAQLGGSMPAKRTRAQASADQARQDAEHRRQAQRRAARPIACQPVRYEQPQVAEAPPVGTLASLKAGIQRYHEHQAVQR